MENQVVSVSEFAKAYKEMVSIEIVEEKAVSYIKDNYKVNSMECLRILFYRFVHIEDIEDTENVWNAFCKQLVKSGHYTNQFIKSVV